MTYIELFLAMRSGDWLLRTSSIKNMAPIFTAFDHPTYQKLISAHLHDLLTIPEAILLMFRQGAFVISICGREGHSVAIDEGHEMLINKQCKMSVVRPSENFINRTASYLLQRTITQEHLKKLIFQRQPKKK